MDTALDQLADTFEMLGEWEERYRHLLIDLGRRLPPLPEDLRTEANQVRGCMSQVWLAAAGGSRARRRACACAAIPTPPSSKA